MRRAKKKEKEVVYENYGRFYDKKPHSFLKLKNESFADLSYKINTIFSNDSLPIISIRKADTIKNIGLYSFQRKNSVYKITRRNIIEIINDSIVKSRTQLKNNTLITTKESFPLDSLNNLLTKHFHNNGQNKDFCECFEKLGFIIGYKTQLNYQEKLLKTLDKVTDIYETVTGRKDILIVIQFILPPPPPTPPVFKNCFTNSKIEK